MWRNEGQGERVAHPPDEQPRVPSSTPQCRGTMRTVMHCPGPHTLVPLTVFPNHSRAGSISSSDLLLLLTHSTCFRKPGSWS